MFCFCIFSHGRWHLFWVYQNENFFVFMFLFQLWWKQSDYHNHNALWLYNTTVLIVFRNSMTKIMKGALVVQMLRAHELINLSINDCLDCFWEIK